MKRSHDEIRKAVRSRYGKLASSKSTGCGCGSGSCCDSGSSEKTPAHGVGYTKSELKQVPILSHMPLGSGHPVAISNLKPGDTILDLGSGAGLDCFLAREKVGDSGNVIGVDMTPEMITLARKSAEESGYENIDFRLGEIENLPVADTSIDVIISNCVINLSPDKSRVFEESYRVLKKGGRLCLSDILAINEIPDEVRENMNLYSSCIGGAALISEMEQMLKDAGFSKVQIKVQEHDGISKCSPENEMGRYVVSAMIEAEK